MNLQVYINKNEVDLVEEFKIVLNRIVNEYRNPTKKTGSYSYTINFPITQNNKAIFNFEQDKKVLGKFRTVYECTVFADGIDVIQGKFELTKISKQGFEGFISGTQVARIADVIGEKKLRDITSFESVTFSGDTSVFASLDLDLNATNSSLCFPYIANSFAQLDLSADTTSNKSDIIYEYFTPSVFAANVVRNIFADADYTVSGSIFSDTTFNKLAITYGQEDETFPLYNYGSLNPFKGNAKFVTDQNQVIAETNGYRVYVLEPDFRYHEQNGALVPGVEYGDLSHSLSDVYTSKVSAEYEIKYNVNWTLRNTNGYNLTHKRFSVFREITENRYIPGDYKNILYQDFEIKNVRNYDVNNSLFFDANQGEGTIKMEENKQYRLQIYVCVPATYSTNLNWELTSTADSSYFEIVNCKAPTELDPALFLPNLDQKEFLNSIFKLFNLYYSIDTDLKHVELFTRDEFFSQNKNNILDLSDNIALDELEETPLTPEEIKETYFNFAKDENDYFLEKTDYMQRVNLYPEDQDIYTLPFSPLAFAQTTFAQGVRDAIPVMIPNQDSNDYSLFKDVETTAKYKPRLFLYEGKKVLKDGLYLNNLAITFSRSQNLLEGGMLTNNGIKFKYIPRISFFNLVDQPAYLINRNDYLRNFELVENSVENIYKTNNLGYLLNADTVIELDKVGLDQRSFFNIQYADNLLINELSNYAEGYIKLDSFLYSKLDGRNILRIEDELYLLESISGYQPNSEFAKIKVYKMLSS